MSEETKGYISGGGGSEESMQSNVDAFSKWKMIPRVLKETQKRNMQIELFGNTYESPLLFAPIGALGMVHPQADLEIAKAAATLKVPYIFSSQASVPMETCAQAMGDNPRWFQLYWGIKKELTKSFVDRAINCGCQAIVLTVDTSVLGWRTKDLNNAYLPFLHGHGIAQYTSDPVFQEIVKMADKEKSETSVNEDSIHFILNLAKKIPGKNLENLKSGKAIKIVKTFTRIFANPGLNWDDLEWLRSHVKIPILLKGILHPDDAKKAKEIGMDGIIVSNHGGRQLGSVISSLDALLMIRKMLPDFPILLDSGIRTGEDIFK
ncbi:MAG: alpha-hydroxy-acid oxidizing protein, partial [Bacteroidota bacterium]